MALNKTEISNHWGVPYNLPSAFTYIILVNMKQLWVRNNIALILQIKKAKLKGTQCPCHEVENFRVKIQT